MIARSREVCKDDREKEDSISEFSRGGCDDDDDKKEWGDERC
jgi:hypothetical protein